jgi:WD40 repeat protein
MKLPQSQMLLGHRKKNKAILFVQIKQNMLLVSLQTGFQVYKITSESSKPELILQGDVPMVQSFDILQESNLIAYLCKDKVVLWNALTSENLAQLEFSTNVCSIRLLSNKLIVCLITKIIVYRLFPLTKIDEFDMYWNEFSVLDVCDDDKQVLAFPARQKGQVQVMELQKMFTSRIVGHSSVISCIRVSDDGMFVATASQNGTLIRIWHSQTGSLKHVLRRGADFADIYSIAFCKLNRQLCVISDKNTLHLYHLSLSGQVRKGSLLSPYLPKYFSSDWSIGSCAIPDLTRSIVQFHSDEVIYLVGSDGTFSTFEIQATLPVRKTYYKYLKL